MLKLEIFWRNACVWKDVKPERGKTSGFVVAKEGLKALVEWSGKILETFAVVVAGYIDPLLKEDFLTDRT